MTDIIQEHLEQLDASAETSRQYGFHSRAELFEESASTIRALLDRLEAAEPWRKHYFDMAKAAGDLKAAVRPQLDAMPFADHAEVRKAFNDIAIVAGRALDHMQPKDAPAIREVKL